jgi:3-oxoacyl-[acyl-carrier protein] reductase
MSQRQPSAPLRCVLTGCASGIGHCLSRRLLQDGHRVLATDIDFDGLQNAAQGWPQESRRLAPLDVRDADAWETVMDDAMDAWQGIDVVMNVAGFLRPARIAEASVEDVHRHFDINVKGVVFGTRAAAQRMLPARRGHIINIASLASLAPIPGIALYSASKYAVRGFSLAAAEELRNHGIAVTTVCPDAVATPMLDLQTAYPEAALTFTAPKFLSVDEVADLVLGKVLRKRPLLVSLPRRRALLARLADLFPAMQRPIASLLERQGLKRQADFKAHHPAPKTTPESSDSAR